MQGQTGDGPSAQGIRRLHVGHTRVFLIPSGLRESRITGTTGKIPLFRN